ncbi:hypothetical protein [Dietzia psychralcaliphila]|nr:hypothetical protein [Dietzia psychralcaliphila]
MNRANAARGHSPVIVLPAVDLLRPMPVPLSDGTRRGSAGASA